MNRSFRAEESLTGPGQRQRQPLMGSIRSSDEELSLFLEMRRRENDRNNNRFLQKSDEFDPLGSKSGSSPAFDIASAAPMRRTRTDEFLNADNDKNGLRLASNTSRHSSFSFSRDGITQNYDESAGNF